MLHTVSADKLLQNIEMLTNFTKINHDEKVALLQKLIKKNVSLDLSNSNNWNSSDHKPMFYLLISRPQQFSFNTRLFHRNVAYSFCRQIASLHPRHRFVLFSCN
jgi:hypothetical protein